jgi:hypothetical protein
VVLTRGLGEKGFKVPGGLHRMLRQSEVRVTFIVATRASFFPLSLAFRDSQEEKFGVIGREWFSVVLFSVFGSALETSRGTRSPRMMYVGDLTRG